MSFRTDASPSDQVFVPEEPFARFMEIHDAFESGRGLFGDRVPSRLAAVTLLTTPGTGVELANAVRRCDERLADRLGWFSSVSSSVRLLVAAVLVKQGDDPDAFLEEIERVREMFRAADLRRGGAFEFLAVLVLRRIRESAAITEEDVARFGAIYEEMKRHHWWLTGPDDFPTCAMLVGRPGAPEGIGEQVEALYQALRVQADLWRGDPLQTAANVLALGGLEPQEAATRFRALLEAFREDGQSIGQGEYDEIAVLCFLAQPIDRIVSSVAEYRDKLRDAISWMSRSMAFSLATSLAFVRLLGSDPRLGTLADAKALVDMHAIVAARQAAAGAAAAAAAT